jgi:HlyD family secretion protein
LLPRSGQAIPIIALTVRERADTEAIDNEDPAVRAAGEAAAEATGDDEAAGKRTDREGVFVVRDGKALFVPVTVGIAGQEYFEVISGVTASDTVVAGPYEVIRTLEDGKAVRPMPTITPAGAPGAAATAARGS